MRLVTVGGFLQMLLGDIPTPGLCSLGLAASLRRPRSKTLAARRVVDVQHAPTGADSAELLHTGSFAA
jgi:hypothetical protein